VQRELLAIRELRELQAHKEILALQARQVRPAHKEFKVFRETKE
jgi:hypothetical protein